jgi:hypothetical protein
MNGKTPFFHSYSSLSATLDGTPAARFACRKAGILFCHQLRHPDMAVKLQNRELLLSDQ